MNETNFDEIRSIYFVGIGGIAMSAAAGIARQKGFEVSGSDSKEVYAPAKDVLDREGISYYTGYDASHIPKASADLYVLSAGEDLQNPEVAYIVQHELPRMSFAELLGKISQDSLRVVVAGTNGKSTTTGCIGHVLKNLDDSSFMTGAVLQNYESNFHFGYGHYFVFEGDEYKSEFDDPTPKFHYYKPDILVLTNLEFDHPDVFENLDAIKTEFSELIAGLPEDGLIVYNADDENLVKLVHESNVSAVSFGVENEADFKLENAQYGTQYTTMEVKNKFSKNISAHLLDQHEQYKIQLPGKINVYNALAAVALLRSLGFQQDQIALDMLSYAGVKRRFEIVGQKGGVTLVDDYAHHPTAVRETLAAAKVKFAGQRILAVFEPHTYSRTRATLHELAAAFADADEVVISKIYPAREKEKDATITAEEVVAAILEKNPDKKKSIHLVQSKQEALDLLKKTAVAGDIILVMAVGSFNRLAYELREIL